MRRYLLSLLILIIAWMIPFSAKASMPICRDYNNQEVCILTIKRSAKNYWEYRVALRVDGKVIPVELYNCRDRTKRQIDGTILPFAADDPGLFLCKSLRYSS
jgi:hypothetical protein